jgi:hypothetical protein
MLLVVYSMEVFIVVVTRDRVFIVVVVVVPLV